jgi:hypothetical protein
MQAAGGYVVVRLLHVSSSCGASCGGLPAAATARLPQLEEFKRIKAERQGTAAGQRPPEPESQPQQQDPANQVSASKTAGQSGCAWRSPVPTAAPSCISCCRQAHPLQHPPPALMVGDGMSRARQPPCCRVPSCFTHGRGARSAAGSTNGGTGRGRRGRGSGRTNTNQGDGNR